MVTMTIKNKIKEYVKLLYTCPNYYSILNHLKESSSSKIVLIGTPAHGNLGDHAIAISELDFLKTKCKDCDIVEIPMPLFNIYKETIKSYINPTDTIIISGGGWMGNLWIHNEITIRQIILDYPHNKIVIFPQTLFYTNDAYGRETLTETKAIFRKHNNLYLSVRDKKSFECAKYELGLQNDRLVFCPDMVVFGTLAQKNESSFEKKTALVCLRNDVEKMSNTSSARSILVESGYVVKDTTTVLNHLIPMKKRVQYVQRKINEFKSATIVITDRLHAMLFAIISGTPCIAFDNATGKVFGVGEYLIKCGLPIVLVDRLSLSDLEKMDYKKREYELPDKLNVYFLKLADIVNDKEMDKI